MLIPTGDKSNLNIHEKSLNMGMPVRIDNQLYEQAKSEAKAEHRTIAGQIERVKHFIPEDWGQEKR